MTHDRADGAMRPLRMINAHAEGEIGFVAIDGVPDVPGHSLAAKLDHLNRVDGGLRRQLALAPRGNPAASVNLVFPPRDEAADAGFLVLQPDQAHASSGSNTICVVTALLEAGILPMSEPVTHVTLETAAGLVPTRAECADGKCVSVSLDMVPSFVLQTGLSVTDDHFGMLHVDICYGGVFYGLVDVRQLGLSITPGNAATLGACGMALRDQINLAGRPVHPDIPEINGVAYVMFHEEMGDGVFRTATVMYPGRLDRSPCGTGSSALLAVLQANGRMAVGESIITESVIGSRFDVMLTGLGQVGGRTAILPRIRGRGWCFGETILTGDPSDPFTKGYAVSDVWGDADLTQP